MNARFLLPLAALTMVAAPAMAATHHAKSEKTVKPAKVAKAPKAPKAAKKAK